MLRITFLEIHKFPGKTTDDLFSENWHFYEVGVHGPQPLQFHCKLKGNKVSQQLVL